MRVFLVVGMFSDIVGHRTADFLGRRYAMVVECVIFAIGVVIQMVSFSSWVQFALGRLVSGLGVGALSAAVPMACLTTSGYVLVIDDLRSIKRKPHLLRFVVHSQPLISCSSHSVFSSHVSALVSVFSLKFDVKLDCVSIGSREIEGPGSWRTVVGIGLAWPAILSVGILFMPESPRWLAKHGKMDAARRSVARVRGIPRSEETTDPLINREVEEIRSNVEYEQNISAGWLDCFKPKNKTLYRTLLGKVSPNHQSHRN